MTNVAVVCHFLDQRPGGALLLLGVTGEFRRGSSPDLRSALTRTRPPTVVGSAELCGGGPVQRVDVFAATPERANCRIGRAQNHDQQLDVAWPSLSAEPLLLSNAGGWTSDQPCRWPTRCLTTGIPNSPMACHHQRYGQYPVAGAVMESG